ncbi:MAG: S-methyl-5'-thioadenosine phosphorylase [Chloroflexi bacterium]|nr:S-methyl-5'-thioadenosine phosphorylase [Chloroflexota bacterium]
MADVAVIGGSGFYELLGDVTHQTVQTPYGPPSDTIAVGTYEGARVAFLARHGQGHRYPPHRINYRANIWALASLGVTRILGPNAAGSLQPNVKPGDFVVCDQFADRTSGRPDTFYDGPPVVHIQSAHPYCPELRELAIVAGRELGIAMHDRGTVVVIQGPRFSTLAESRWYSSAGWSVINMTQYPELILARELEVCYVGISLITDYDAGLEGRPDIEPVSVAGVVEVFHRNNARVRDLLLRLIPRIPRERSCICAHALTGAIIG